MELAFVQVAADEYVDVREVRLGQHVQWVFGQENAVHGGRGREPQNAGIAVPLFFGYGARVDGPQARHGADRVVRQRRRVALAVVQQFLRYLCCPFARHVAPGRVHRARLYDPAPHQTLSHRRNEMHAHLQPSVTTLSSLSSSTLSLSLLLLLLRLLFEPRTVIAFFTIMSYINQMEFRKRFRKIIFILILSF